MLRKEHYHCSWVDGKAAGKTFAVLVLAVI